MAEPRVYGESSSSARPWKILVLLLSIGLIVVSAALIFVLARPQPIHYVYKTAEPLPPPPVPVAKKQELSTTPAPAPAPQPVPVPAAPPPPPTKTVAPVQFKFNYQNNPVEPREWRRTTETTWEELDTRNVITRFNVVARINEPKRIGTVVRRTPDQKMDVLIPDKGASNMMYWRTAPDGPWVYMGDVAPDAGLPPGPEKGEF